MKRFMYFLVPFCKWVANYTAMWAVFTYLIPVPIGRYYEMAIGWVASGLIAAPFAYWAFHKQIPTNKQLGIFLGSWVVVTFLMETVIAYIGYHYPLSMLFRYELLVQIIIEVAVVLVMERVMRRQHAYHMAAEGIELHN